MDSFHVCPVLGSPALDPALQTHLTSAEKKGNITSLDLLVPKAALLPTRTPAAVLLRDSAPLWLLGVLGPWWAPRALHWGPAIPNCSGCD